MEHPPWERNHLQLHRLYLTTGPCFCVGSLSYNQPPALGSQCVCFQSSMYSFLILSLSLLASPSTSFLPFSLSHIILLSNSLPPSLYICSSSHAIGRCGEERSFPGGSVVKNLPANARDVDSVSGSGRFLGVQSGSLLQYSCLENPMDRGAWWATVHGVAQGQTRLCSSNSQEEGLLGALLMSSVISLVVVACVAPFRAPVIHL